MSTDWSQILLDLLNTTPVVDGVAHDALDDDAAARAWLRQRGGDGNENLGAVRDVRDELQGVVRGGLDARVLNSYLAGVRRVPSIHAHGLDWPLEAPDDWCGRVVLTWGEVQNDGPGRLRACANADCRLFLLDRSRGGTGRWCSMSGCGNRMKARRHYRRAAGKPGS